MNNPQTLIFLSPTPVTNHILSSQGLPQLLLLSQDYGWRVKIISFESAMTDKTEEDIQHYFYDLGIEWFPVFHPHRTRILRLLPASLFTALKAIGVLRKVLRQSGNKVVIHCRSYAAAFVAYVGHKLGFFSCPWFFDVRGIYPDELVRDGVWQHSDLKYKLAKAFEQLALRDARHVFVVNGYQLGVLAKSFERASPPKLTVIPHSVNTIRFRGFRSSRSQIRAYLGVKRTPAIVWMVGAIRPVHVPGMVKQFFHQFVSLFPTAVLLVLTKDGAESVKNILSISDSNLRVISAQPEDVPRFLSACDLALSFIHSAHEGLGIKFSEYLASGVPVVTNMCKSTEQTDLLNAHRIGIPLESDTGMASATNIRDIRDLISNNDVIKRCYYAANISYSLHMQVQKYNETYRAGI